MQIEASWDTYDPTLHGIISTGEASLELDQIVLVSSTRKSGAGELHPQSLAFSPDNCVVRNPIVRCHASSAAGALYASGRSSRKTSASSPGMCRTRGPLPVRGGLSRD